MRFTISIYSRRIASLMLAVCCIATAVPDVWAQRGTSRSPVILSEIRGDRQTVNALIKRARTSDVPVNRRVSYMNHAAWVLATSKDSRVRDPATAVRLMKPLIDAGVTHYTLLDTLACAYANAGDLRMAELYINRASDSCKPAEGDNTLQFLDAFKAIADHSTAIAFARAAASNSTSRPATTVAPAQGFSQQANDAMEYLWKHQPETALRLYQDRINTDLELMRSLNELSK